MKQNWRPTKSQIKALEDCLGNTWYSREELFELLAGLRLMLLNGDEIKVQE